MGFETWGLGIGLGYFALPISGLGLTGHYRLGSDLRIEAAIYRGTYDGKDFLKNDPASSVVLDTFDVSGALNYVGVQYFLGEHFYTAAGVGSRTIVFDLKAHSGTDVVHEKLQADAGVTRIALGNNWSFPGGFYVTGEWAALSIPVTSMVSTDITATGAVSEDIETLETDAIRIVDREAKRYSFGITVQLGWEF